MSQHAPDTITRREWLRRWAQMLGLPPWITDAAIATTGRRAYWTEPVDPMTGESRAFRWVRRNEDKPHRCPECHHVVTWNRARYAPRTRLKCDSCRVQWRSGMRVW
jgi:hypothetical protein